MTAGAVLAGALGLAAMGLYFYLGRTKSLPVTEFLWAGVLGYLLVLLGVAWRTVGWERLKPHQFAVWFLVFFIPLPLALALWSGRSARVGEPRAHAPAFRIATD